MQISSWKHYAQTSTHEVGNPMPIHDQSFSPFMAMMVSVNDESSAQTI